MTTYQLFVSIVFFISAVLLLLMGAVVLRDNPRRRLNRITGFMLILVGLGPLFTAVGSFFEVTSGVGRPGPVVTGLSLTWELFFPQLVLFALVFPIERPFAAAHPRVKFLIFLPHVFHVILATLFYDPNKIVDWLTVDNPPAWLGWAFDQVSLGLGFLAALLSSIISFHLEFFAVVNLVYVLIASALLYQGYNAVTDRRLRTQTSIVIWGMRLAVGLYVVAFILPALGVIDLSSNVRATITIVSLFIGAGSVVLAIIRHQFLDIRLIVRQSLVYTVTSGVLVGMYMLLISQLGKLTRSILGRDAPIIDVAFIIVALVFFQPVMSWVDNLIKRFFIRDKTDFRNITEQFSVELASVFSLDELQANVTRILKNQMLAEDVWFCMRDVATGQYSMSIRQADGYEPELLTSDDEFLQHLRQHQKPVPIEDLAGSITGKSCCWDLIRDTRCHLIVPLHDSSGPLGFVGLARKVTGFSYNYEDMTTLNILGNQLSTAITKVWLYEESLEKQRLEREMALARQIQTDLLPKTIPYGTKFQFAAFTEPALQVGGDYFDFLQTARNNIGVVVADASGKGMPAALLISQLQATLRSEVRHDRPLQEMIANANYLISTSSSPEKFVTLFFGELESDSLKLHYCNAGHNYPFVIRHDGQTDFLRTGGLLVGAFSSAKYEWDTYQLMPGDLVFLYTDGLNEAHDASSNEFGEERLVEFVRSRKNMSPRELTEAVISEVRSFTGEQAAEDDMTVIVLKINNV
jgi:serine phosphatase RsbU (regulator of sigma subunit)